MHNQPVLHYLSVYRVHHPAFPEHVLYGGQYPGAADTQIHSSKVQELLSLNISAAICLMEAHELAVFSPYLPDLMQAQPGFRWLHSPITDMSIPGDAQMTALLDSLDALLAEHERVYVHCWGGHGRTGVVIGCWLKRHGLKTRQILRCLQDWRQQTLFGSIPSPQSDTQFAMLERWSHNQ